MHRLLSIWAFEPMLEEAAEGSDMDGVSCARQPVLLTQHGHDVGQPQVEWGEHAPRRGGRRGPPGMLFHTCAQDGLVRPRV